MRAELITIDPHLTVVATIFAGLAVHRTWTDSKTDGWNVTHVSTGKRIGPTCYLRREACRLAAELNFRADWDFSQDAWDSLETDRRNSLQAMSRDAISCIAPDAGKPEPPEPPYWENLAAMFSGTLIGVDDDDILWVANHSPEGIVRSFEGYRQEYAELESLNYLVASDWRGNGSLYFDDIELSTGIPVGDGDAEPFGLDADRCDELSACYVTESLGYCESCEKSGDTEDYSLGWTVVDECTLVCGKCYDSECDSGATCRGCAHTIENCQDTTECAQYRADDDSADDAGCPHSRGDSFCGDPSCSHCGNDSDDSADERHESSYMVAGGHSREFAGLSHDERKATLDARIATALAEYSPRVPLYNPQ